MIAALLALAGGAVAGIFLAARHFMRKKLPVWVAFLHGVGGATGFTFVLVTVVREPNFRPIREVLYLLIATVLLGAVNLLFHIRKVRHRTSLILLHGMTAVTSAVMLIRAILVHVPEAPQGVPPTAPPPASTGSPIALGSAPRAADAQGRPNDAPATDTARASDTAAKSAPDTFAVEESIRRVLDQPISFDTKSADVSESSTQALDEIAKTLKDHPEIALIEVQGHADERGDDGRNVALTLARAPSRARSPSCARSSRPALHANACVARATVRAVRRIPPARKPMRRSRVIPRTTGSAIGGSCSSCSRSGKIRTAVKSHVRAGPA
jgi:outer membrane protein OmpA-like peptidoglycan-associated protein